MWGAHTSAVQSTHLPAVFWRDMLAVLGRSPELLGDHREPGRPAHSGGAGRGLCRSATVPRPRTATVRPFPATWEPLTQHS